MEKAYQWIKRNSKLFLFVIFCIVALFLCGIVLGGTQPAYATTTSNAIGEIWDSTANKFNQKTVEKLYDTLGGSNISSTNFSAKFNDLNSWASTARTSADFRANNGNANVVVTLGGKQWVATYLTQANGNLVLTLLLADCATVQSSFSSYASSSTCYTYPTDSYGSSYIRASLLSGNPVNLNSTNDTTGVSSYVASAGATSLTAMTEATSLGTEFSAFTSGALSSFILSPEQVGYQENIEIYPGFSAFPYSTSNDAYGDVPTSHYAAGSVAFDYYHNTTVKTDTYVRWKQDKIWIPSYAELGFNDTTNGFWKTDTDLRQIGSPSYMTRSSGYSSHYGYYVMANGIGGSDLNYFADATHVTNIRPAIHLNLSATALTSNSGIAKPTRNTTTFTFNNTNQTYNPTGFDSDVMTITGNVQKNVKIKDGSTTHEADPDGYEVVVSLKTGYNWMDGTTSDIKFNFVIHKADPEVHLVYSEALPDPMYVSYGLPTLTCTSVPTGTIKWDDNQIASTSVTDYRWTFTPSDEDNYNVKTGVQQLTYTGATANGIQVRLKDNVDIYDKYDTITYSSLSDYLKSCISVYASYNDGSVDSSPLPSSSYSITTSDITVSSGDAEDKTISVRVTAEGTLQNRTGSVTANVKKAKIENMNVYDVSNPVTLKYPVTLDQIKANYEVFLTWNFDTTREIQADNSLVSVAVKQTSSNPNGEIKAGSIDLVFTYTNGTLVKTAEVSNCIIAKGDIDMSGITFSDKSEAYDGQPKSLEISGTLPDGITGVTYSSSGDNTTVGRHTITATFTVDTDNYNPVSDMTAVLNITNSGYDMSGVTFTGDTITYDGQPHTLGITGNLPNPDIVVTYEYNKDGVVVPAPNGVTDAGVYTVTARFSNPDPQNYGDIAPMTATLTINKATFDMSGVSFEDKTVTENGTSAFTLEITGSLPNPGIVVTYTVAGTADTSFTSAGVYEFTASFSNPDPTNYNNIADMTATLTIEENTGTVVPTPENPPNNGDSILEKIKKFFDELLEKNFPLWQIITMTVAGLLALIFMIKAIQYGNRRKKAKGEIRKYGTKTYAGLLPVFATDIVLAGLSNQVWSIMAFSFVGLALIMFIIALVMRKSWKKAESAKEQVMIENGIYPQSGNQLVPMGNSAMLIADLRRELQETLAKANDGSHNSQDNESIIEEMRREMEERRREENERRRADEERHRQEIDELREEQAKRDEAMKIMLANMMGRQQGENGMASDFATINDTDLLVQKVIAGLLPMVQQMIPEPTAYLSAPNSANSEELVAMTNVLQQQNEQIAELQNKLDNMAQYRVEAELLPDQSEELRAMAEAHQREMSAVNAEMDAMRSQLNALSFMSVDEMDDNDFDDEEEWDSVLDEDDDDFVESVVIEADGTVKKTYPNFRMRLKQSSDTNRVWYTAIKNLFCSQKGVTYRVYKRVEKIRYQGQVIAVIGIAKKSIKLWLALKPYEYDARRYHHKDISDKPRFVDVPMYVRVSSDRALTRAEELILALFQELNMEARKRYTDRSIQELIFTLKHNRLLTNKATKGLLCEMMHVHDCNVLDDETAEKCIETKNVDFIDESAIETVKLDDIDAKFQDGNRVTLERLKKVGLVSEECTGYTVTANKRLTKPLIIVANDFTLTAVKLIALTGGRAIKLAQVQ